MMKFNQSLVAIILLHLLAFPALAAHTTDTLLMVSPDQFKYNDQAAQTNKFQNKIGNVGSQPLKEFKAMVAQLEQNDIKVITLSNRSGVDTPDAVFPNNWFSVIKRDDGQQVLVIYPMLNKNRQDEKQVDNLVKTLVSKRIKIDKIVDYSYFEKQEKALEGTGSMILDRVHKVAFASLSPRTNTEILAKFSKDFGYTPVTFTSYDINDNVVYHTNVVMSDGSEFAVLCADCIKDHKERSAVLAELAKLHKEIIRITPEQVQEMSGNILEVKNTQGEPRIILSKRAHNAFTAEQQKTLQKFGQLVIVKIPVIENVGGGSARCMIAEVFH